MPRTPRREVYAAIDSERSYQGMKWGDPTKTVAEYILYMEHYLGRARAIASSTDMSGQGNKAKAMDEIRKVTALGVVCMEDNGAPQREGPGHNWAKKRFQSDTDKIRQALRPNFSAGTNTGGFQNADELEWLDISHEMWREYMYADGTVIRIEEPLRLNVKQKSGGDSHRVVTSTLSHYIAPGWHAIRWERRPGTAPFSF
jgi:hypothetical protein